MILDSYLGHLSYGDCNDLFYKNINKTLCNISIGDNITLN